MKPTKPKISNFHNDTSVYVTREAADLGEFAAEADKLLALGHPVADKARALFLRFVQRRAAGMAVLYEALLMDRP